MTEDFTESLELSREFDIVAEIEKALDDIEKSFELLETDDVPEKIAYLKFLIRDLDEKIYPQKVKVETFTYYKNRGRTSSPPEMFL